MEHIFRYMSPDLILVHRIYRIWGPSRCQIWKDFASKHSLRERSSSSSACLKRRTGTLQLKCNHCKDLWYSMGKNTTWHEPPIYCNYCRCLDCWIKNAHRNIGSCSSIIIRSSMVILASSYLATNFISKMPSCASIHILLLVSKAWPRSSVSGKLQDLVNSKLNTNSTTVNHTKFRA